MKILYHHRTISRDGQDVHIQEMIAALRRRGHEVIVAAPAGAQHASFGSDGGALSRIRHGLPRWISELLEFAYSLVAYRRLCRLWRREKPDLLYERYNLFLLAGAWLKARSGLPLLLEVNSPIRMEREQHSGLALRSLASWCERRAWRSADRVLPVTGVLAGHVSGAGVPRSRIEVVPNGVDRRRFHPEDGARSRAELGLEGQLVLGFTGFIRSWHGLGLVLDVMASGLEGFDPRFLVLGDGPGRDALQERATALGLAGRVICLGLVDRDRVAGYVAAFDVALQPAVVDYASPLKLFEYMALGKAILAPDQPNIREVLTHEVDALLFEPGSGPAFQDELRRLCCDPALRQRLGSAAARTLEERDYTWDGNARRVEALVQALSSPKVQG